MTSVERQIPVSTRSVMTPVPVESMLSALSPSTSPCVCARRATRATLTWPVSRLSARWTMTAWTHTPAGTRSAARSADPVTYPAAEKLYVPPSATRLSAPVRPASLEILASPALPSTVGPTLTVPQRSSATTTTALTRAQSRTLACSLQSVPWWTTRSTAAARLALKDPREPRVQRLR